MSARLPRQVLCLVCPCSLIELGPGCLPHLAHDVPHVGVVHGVARYRSRVAIEDVHQVSLLAVLQNQVKLVHLPAHRPNASEKENKRDGGSCLFSSKKETTQVGLCTSRRGALARTGLEGTLLKKRVIF